MTRIAVLETDTPVPNVQAKYHSYGDIFENLLRNAGLPEDVQVSKHHVVEATDDSVYPNIDEIDGVLITGSKHNSYETIPWINRLVEYTQKLVDKKVPIVGICFGHQIVGRALGVKVGKNTLGWEVSSVPIELTDRGKQLIGPYLSRQASSTVHIMQMHQDIVHELPADTELLASTEVCKVQGFYRSGGLLTFQGHPEFNEMIVKEIVAVRHSTGLFSDATASEYTRRASQENDGPNLARAMAKFLTNQGHM